MSKLSQLKQKAYQAGKDRNWDMAISIYEQILEVEKSNPTVINELGDLCLKAGDSRQAVKHFLSSATKYRKTGLLNNSVAICKKILRHDGENMHAHWYLAEIRSSQDLTVEGEAHALSFLESGSKAAGEIQEIFLKRCLKLLELYPGSRGILENLGQVFRSYDKQLEAGRSGCLLACLAYDSGDKESAQKMVDDILVASPELRNYPEFGTWNKRVNPTAAGTGPMADYNSVSLGSAAEEPADAEPAAPVNTAASAGPAENNPLDKPKDEGETSFSGIKIDVPVELDGAVADEPAAEPAAEVADKDDEGCLVIDAGESSDMADLIAAAARDLEQASGADEASDELDEPADDTPTVVIPADTETASATETAAAAPAEPAAEAPSGSVDLLSQILAEDSDAVLGDASNQVDTIASEIGSMVGGEDADDDADRLYEMGLVYLEMGLFDKACDSFETAAADDDYTIRAHEMWGLTLLRAERPDEAITVLTSGMQFAEADSRENLGLRYHIAMAHEAAGRPDTAIDIYEEIQAVAPNFLDIKSRLQQLAGV